MGTGTGQTQFPTPCESTVRTAAELRDPYQHVGAEKSPNKLAGNMAAYIWLCFLNPSSKHLDAEDFEFPM